MYKEIELIEFGFCVRERDLIKLFYYYYYIFKKNIKSASSIILYPEFNPSTSLARD